jgi:hypothetical protein
MRFSQKRIYREHEQRVIKRFAWFPITCRQGWDNRVDSQTVWLKTVYVRQEYHPGYHTWWSSDEFVGEEEYNAHLEETRAILAGPHPPHGGRDRFR